MPVAARLASAFYCGVCRDRVGPLITLTGILEGHRDLRLAAADQGVWDPDRSAVPEA